MGRTTALGVAIRLAREDLKLTQLELSKRARVGRSHLSRIENGRYSPGLGTLARIAKALKTDTSRLLAA
jgi:transcriptional regulator with XRE-family HTH domain